MRQFRVMVNGNEYRVAIEELSEGAGSEAKSVSLPQATIPSPNVRAEPKAAPASPAAANPQTAASNGAGNIQAAMPGTILEIKVSVGDKVTAGQPLLVLEAMKMENDVMAPHDGEVKEILVNKGASVNSGDRLMVIG